MELAFNTKLQSFANWKTTMIISCWNLKPVSADENFAVHDGAQVGIPLAMQAVVPLTSA